MQLIEKNSTNILMDAHAQLALYNYERLCPKKPTDDWPSEVRNEARLRMLEGNILEIERRLVQKEASKAPRDTGGFLKWFEELRNSGPGQNDPLFDWLASSADRREMTWFIRQEIAGEAGFDDLAALTQLKMPSRPKLEIARNYWDEMGRGSEHGMHGPMLTEVARELRIDLSIGEPIVPEALALGNILLGLAINRRYAYHSVGALGAVELTAPDRALRVAKGLKRLGITPRGQRYYRLHSTLDVKHSRTWNEEVIAPLVESDPSLAVPIAEGALMRLKAGARCFERYRAVLWAKLRH